MSTENIVEKSTNESSIPPPSELFIYNYYDTNNLDIKTPFVIQGNIVNDSEQIICKGLPISKDLVHWDNLSEKYNEKKYLIRPFYEGSLLRIFNYKENWHIATSRKLDAFQSKWGSYSSFGELFQDFLKKEYMIDLEQFYLTLNKNFVYYFLFTCESVFYIHPSSSSSLKILFVIDKNGEKIVDENEFYIPRIEYSDYETVKQKYFNNELLGVVLENDNERYTLFSSNYETRKKLYGTKKYLAQRILELLENDQEKTEYLKYFPESQKYFKLIESEIRFFCKKVHKTYMQRYISKNFIQVEPSVNHFVKVLHNNFKENKKITSYQVVLDTFNSLGVDSKFTYIRPFMPSSIGGKKLE